MARWFCRLDPDDHSAWQRGDLEAQARFLSIQGWLLSINVDGQGNLVQFPNPPSAPDLPWAWELHCSDPLSPQAERNLLASLQEAWCSEHVLHLLGRPVIVLRGLKNLSSLKFALQRFRKLHDQLLILSSDFRPISGLEENDLDVDGWLDSSPDQMIYIRNLKQAHHRLAGSDLEVPGVWPMDQDLEKVSSDSPNELYREWLEQASAWSELANDGAIDAPVCIQDWAGHCRLMTPSILKEKSVEPESWNVMQTPSTDERGWGESSPDHLALMIHGFYPDVLDDILLKLPSFCAGTVGTQLDLYVSTPMDQIDQVEKKLRDLDFACVRLFGVENRGRDVAPFLLHLLPAVEAAGHHFFVKLHTKKSLQFGIDGLDKWSRHLIESLLSAAGLEAIRYQFLNAKDLGCLCPSGTLLPLAIALFKNKAHLHHLLSHSEINGRWALAQKFVAGSMFAGRVEAFRPLLDQGFSLDDFELEGGQFDGTLAHALERLISLEIKRSGWQIKEMSGNPGAVPGFGYGLVD